jgi:hypothetical protein
LTSNDLTCIDHRVPGGFQLGLISPTLQKLRVLHIHCDDVKKCEVVTLLKGPWLPALRRLVLCPPTKVRKIIKGAARKSYDPNSGYLYNAWFHIDDVQRARSTVKVKWCGGDDDHDHDHDDDDDDDHDHDHDADADADADADDDDQDDDA